MSAHWEGLFRQVCPADAPATARQRDSSAQPPKLIPMASTIQDSAQEGEAHHKGMRESNARERDIDFFFSSKFF